MTCSYSEITFTGPCDQLFAANINKSNNLISSIFSHNMKLFHCQSHLFLSSSWLFFFFFTVLSLTPLSSFLTSCPELLYRVWCLFKVFFFLTHLTLHHGNQQQKKKYYLVLKPALSSCHRSSSSPGSVSTFTPPSNIWTHDRDIKYMNVCACVCVCVKVWNPVSFQ